MRLRSTVLPTPLREDEAARRAPGSYPVERDRRALDDLVATGKLRRRRASAGGVRVEARVHIEGV
jgi:hypothetical protein